MVSESVGELGQGAGPAEPALWSSTGSDGGLAGVPPGN